MNFELEEAVRHWHDATGPARATLMRDVIDQYRDARVYESQVVDASAAETLKSHGEYSSVKVQRDSTDVWLARNGRWLVKRQRDGSWLLERLIGGRWESRDGDWIETLPTLLRRRQGTFTSSIDALRHAVEVDRRDGIPAD